MKTDIRKRTEGASEAKGQTVIIDVFRAFTLEAYAFFKGCEKIILVRTVDEAYELKQSHPEYILIGERDGRKLPGADFGNSPYAIENADFTGKTIVHTTTNGVNGILHAINSDGIVTGAFVNAKATMDYVKKLNPETVTIVAMGWKDGDTEEDLLCAEYMKALLEGKQILDIDQKIDDLRYLEGKKFFNPDTQDIFPKEDFDLCIRRDIFDFVIKIEKEGTYVTARCIHA